MTDATPPEPSAWPPDWPLPDLEAAARAHWDDAPRLRLLLLDLGDRPEAGALRDRVAARLRDLPPRPVTSPVPRTIRRDPAALGRRGPPPPPADPTPEMAALLRLLELERAQGRAAREEAAELRRHLEALRARRQEDDALRRERDALREEARSAREEAARLAHRLAFASASPRRPPDSPGPAPRAAPVSRAPQPDPAYAELGLSPDLPDDLLAVFERALLRHHHPDRAPPEARDAATARFQSVTKAFQRLRKLRGL